MKVKLNIKNVLTLTFIAIIITLVSLFFINKSFAANTAVIAVETANLRETPSSTSKILELLNKGESVEIEEKKEDWYKVKYKGIEGYLRSDLITLSNGESKTNNTVETNTSNSENTQNEVKTEESEVSKNTVEQTNSASKNDDEAEENGSAEIKGKYKAKEDITLKVIPLINALDLENISKDTEIEVTDVMNYWAYVNVKDKQGWVILQKLEKLEDTDKNVNATTTKTENDTKTEETTKTSDSNTEQKKVLTTDTSATSKTTQASKKMYVNSQTVNVRKSADRNSELLEQIAINTEVEVVSEENGWSKVKYNGKQGYIFSSLLSNTKQETSRGSEQPRTSNTVNNANTTNNANSSNASNGANNNGTTSNSSNVSTKGADVVAYAKQFIGVKYTYGGTSPSTGFDCSGFTSYVYKKFGISLPRTSDGQAGVGTAVSRANLALGDLVIYNGHVAIYVGGGNVIHAPRPGKNVCIVPLDQAGYGFSGARRVLK